MTATPHDGIYKQIFSHPQVVEASLRGFVHENWVEHVDLSTDVYDVIWRRTFEAPGAKAC